VRSAFESLLGVTLEVGSVSIAGSAVATALAVALATFILAGVTGFILDREIVPLLQLRPGAGYAAVTFTRWVIVMTDHDADEAARYAIRITGLRVPVIRVTWPRTATTPSTYGGALGTGVGAVTISSCWMSSLRRRKRRSPRRDPGRQAQSCDRCPHAPPA